MTTTTMRSTLRRIAEEGDTTERVRLSDLFASQLELLLNDHNNKAQFALSRAEEDANAKIDALRVKVGEVHEQISYNNTLQSQVIAAVRESNAAINARLDEFAAAFGSVNARLDAKRARIEALERRADDADARLADLERRMAALERRNDGLD